VQKILDSLRRVIAVAAINVESRLALTLDPAQELGPLELALTRLRSQGPIDGAGRPSGIDPDALWARWTMSTQSSEEFSLRELRALCWDSRAVEDLRFLELLESDGHIPKRGAFLRGLWHCHQHHWRLRSASRLESYFLLATTQAEHRTRWLEQLNELPEMLTDNAARSVGRALFARLDAVGSTIDNLRLTAPGQLAQLALRACRSEWLDALKLYAEQNDPRVISVLHQGLGGLLHSDLTSKEDFPKVVEWLLELLDRSGDAYRKALADWIVSDRRLGHPRRIGTSANWMGVSEKARLAALRLFAAKDIGRFFDILIGRQFDTQSRRPFWEQYINSPQFVDYAIACDPEDRKRLIANWTDGVPDVARLDGAPDRHSAFIMRFRTIHYDLIVVEMSRANNAMYLFDTSDFEDEVGTLEKSRFRFSALKNRSVAARTWSHSHSWQFRFAGNLREFGIVRGPQ